VDRSWIRLASDSSILETERVVRGIPISKVVEGVRKHNAFATQRKATQHGWLYSCQSSSREYFYHYRMPLAANETAGNCNVTVNSSPLHCCYYSRSILIILMIIIILKIIIILDWLWMWLVRVVFVVWFRFCDVVAQTTPILDCERNMTVTVSRCDERRGFTVVYS